MHRAKLATLLFLLGGLTTAGAETLQMPPEEQAPAQTEAPEQAAPMDKPLLALELPARGMSMREVEARFGEPLAKQPPVGDPPIIRWEYADYTVYFEGRYVIHTVLTRQ